MSTMTITLTIERTPRTLQVGAQTFAVEELSVRLPFARKPFDLSQVCGTDLNKVFVTETRELTPTEFDAFASTLLLSHDWLSGKGGCIHEGYLCIEVTAPGRPYLYVNSEGADYCRYVARLG